MKTEDRVRMFFEDETKDEDEDEVGLNRPRPHLADGKLLRAPDGNCPRFGARKGSAAETRRGPPSPGASARQAGPAG